MERIDITRELLTAPAYPGDPPPQLEALSRIELGDVRNTSLLHTCLHTGTHLDVPRHFFPDGADTEQALLEGLDLSAVEPGGYFLFAAPLKIRDGDGSPVRAVLVRE